MSESEPITYEESSGNVFSDLGLPNAEILLLKTELMLRIRDDVAIRGWDVARTATALAMPIREVERLDTSDPDALSLDTLLSMLAGLGYDVAIRVAPSASRSARFTTEIAAPASGDTAAAASAAR